MGNPTTIITHNQRVIDQLALENLNNLKSEKVQRKRRLVIGYLQRKSTHFANLDDSVIDRMDKDEFNRIFKKAKIRHNLVFVCMISWFLLLIFGIIGGFVLAINGKNIGAPIMAGSIFSFSILIYVYEKIFCSHRHY